MRDGVTPDAGHLQAIRPNPVHAAGLVGLFAFNEGGGDRVRDAVGLIGDGALGPANHWVQGPHGAAVRHNRSVNAILHFPGSVKAGPFTALWRGTFRNGPGAAYWAGEWHHGYIGGQNASWGFNVGTGGFAAFRAANRQLVSAIEIPIGRPLTLIGSYDGARADLYACAGGVVSHLGNSGSGFVTDSRYTLRLGGFWGGNGTQGTEDLDTDLFVLWRRKLTPGEALALVRAPWRAMEAPRRRIYRVAGDAPMPPMALAVGPPWHAHAATAAMVIQKHRLSPTDAWLGHGAQGAAVGQQHAIGPAPARHAHGADLAVLSAGKLLQAQDPWHAQAAVMPGIAQVHEIGPAFAGHVHGADATAVAAGKLLLAHDLWHGQGATAPGILQGHDIAPALARHPHVAGMAAIWGGQGSLPGLRLTVEREGRVRRPGPDPRIFIKE